VNASGNRLRITTLLVYRFDAPVVEHCSYQEHGGRCFCGEQTLDIPLADLVKLCKGIQKAWPDGKSFTLVIKNPGVS